MKRKLVRVLVLVVIWTISSCVANAQVRPQRVRVAPQIAANRLFKRVPPKYPSDAKAQHVQGAVVLRVNVDKQGNVSEVTLVSGPPELVPVSIEAVKQWKYDPYILNGVPVAMETQVTVNFALQQ